MTPREHEELRKRLAAHLRCAARNPHKRKQHLNSAKYCAQMLGIELPTPPPGVRTQFSTKSWLAANRGFFVRTEDRARRCSLCAKRIAAGEQYFGMNKYNVRVTRAGGLRFRATQQRLHAACAQSVL